MDESISMRKTLKLSSLSLVRLVIAVGRELNCKKLEVMSFGPCFSTRFLGFPCPGESAPTLCALSVLLSSLRISEALVVVLLEFVLMKLVLMVHLMRSLRQRCSCNLVVL